MFSKNSKNDDPWYLHAGLYLIVAILTFLLIKVAVIDPSAEVKAENYFKKETRLRMTNLKEAEILFEKKNGAFTGDLDKLINFVKNDKFVDSVVNAFDSLTMKPANPFIKLSDGTFTPDSLYYSPKTHERFVMNVDTSVITDTVVNPRGKVLRVETKTVIGTKYYIEDPNGYGTIGSIDNDALKNTASWE
ncbi:MAG: hypothetical protein IT276_06365 [Ignavibacteriaceae bacterium]|nr:hypothetical protein [Ignavibacterium sp.]MCC6254518.1 hypothetical protein [Ignavibacteriaceae bacterium]HMN23550.1 hypothetical protein [Ignavibacteriaceae bacterium]HRN25502.1 hypothetical protein [Ignavibacteriaceae bacterium]HRP93203.1 hypothetical protein [Ignavibacteriaceae bacterium]